MTFNGKEVKKSVLFQASQESAPTTTINALTLGTIIDSIRNQAERFKLQDINPDSDERMQICLERFAQSIQLGIMSHIITGSIPQLLRRLETLPKNPLLTTVLKKQEAIYF